MMDEVLHGTIDANSRPYLYLEVFVLMVCLLVFLKRWHLTIA